MIYKNKKTETHILLLIQRKITSINYNKLKLLSIETTSSLCLRSLFVWTVGHDVGYSLETSRQFFFFAQKINSKPRQYRSYWSHNLVSNFIFYTHLPSFCHNREGLEERRELQTALQPRRQAERSRYAVCFVDFYSSFCFSVCF